jgi:hypothetical protein
MQPVPQKRAFKRYLPAAIVSGILFAAFLLPGGPLAAFAFYGYGYAVNYGGITLAGGPDTSAPSAADEWVFFEGLDRAAWYAHYDTATQAFSGNTSVGGVITADPGVVFHGVRTELLVRGSDNQMYHKRHDGTSWSNWSLLGGLLTTGPDASVRGTGSSIDAWVGGTDNQLYHMWSDDGGATWTPWQALGGILTSDPRAVSWGNSTSRVDVFVRGSDYQLYHKFWDISIGWSNWEALGGILTSAPDVASCQTGHLDVFVRGTDNAVWTKWWNGSSWSAWTNLGGKWTSSVSAICRPGTNIIDLFMRGTDNTLWTFNTPSH